MRNLARTMAADISTQILGCQSKMGLSNMRVSMYGDMLNRDGDVIPASILEGRAVMDLCEDMALILQNFAGIYIHPLALYEEYLQYEAAPTVFEKTLISTGRKTAEEIQEGRDRFRNQIRKFANTGEGVFQKIEVKSLWPVLESEEEDDEDV